MSHTELAPDLLRLQSRYRPSAKACVDLHSGAVWTYREFDDLADRMAVCLQQDWAVRPGDRVAVLAANSAHQLALRHACQRLGAVFVPVNWRLAPPEIGYIVSDANPVLLVHDDEHAETAELVCSTLPRCLAEELDTTHPVPLAAYHAAFDDPVIILYTSGTSGRPKGVVLTLRNEYATALNYSFLGQVDAQSAALCEAPMFHVIALLATAGSLMLTGGCLVLSRGFEPNVTLQRLSDPALAVTHYFCVPQMADRLRRAAGFDPARLSHLKALFTGGAPNPPADIRRWLADGIAMVNGYGMTECGTLIGMPLDRSLIEARIESAGVPGPLVELRIVDELGVARTPGDVGEIQVRGPNVSPGYWQRPEETARAFSMDGWLRTGDLGRADTEGYISIVGRIKEMFISGGENVYPVEVESCLIEMPGVLEAAVVGRPDAQWGEVGIAHVVVEADGPDEAALRAYLQTRLARYKIPAAFTFLKELPRNGVGKVNKAALA